MVKKKNVGHFTKVDPSVSHQQSPATAILLSWNTFCAQQAEMFIKQRWLDCRLHGFRSCYLLFYDVHIGFLWSILPQRLKPKSNFKENVNSYSEETPHPSLPRRSDCFPENCKSFLLPTSPDMTPLLEAYMAHPFWVLLGRPVSNPGPVQWRAPSFTVCPAIWSKEPGQPAEEKLCLSKHAKEDARATQKVGFSQNKERERGRVVAMTEEIYSFTVYLFEPLAQV